MASGINDGGPAFPQPPEMSRHYDADDIVGAESYHIVEHAGMTLRAYYAGMFMAANIAHPTMWGTAIPACMIAGKAVTQADALIAALAESAGK